MAAFLVRALQLPPARVDYFGDDSGLKFEDDINALRAAGVTYGCADGRFCPDGLVTRGQMAAFLVRAYDLPASNDDYFTDDSRSTFEGHINALRASGTTYGCSGSHFCPDGLVTRGQMVAFLHRASVL
jgi:hypothetical protein